MDTGLEGARGNIGRPVRKLSLYSGQKMTVGTVDIERNGMFLDIHFGLHKGLDLMGEG